MCEMPLTISEEASSENSKMYHMFAARQQKQIPSAYFLHVGGKFHRRVLKYAPYVAQRAAVVYEAGTLQAAARLQHAEE